MEKNKFICSLVARMSERQKVGALLTLGFAGTVVHPHIVEFIEKYHCGGLRLSCDARTFGSYVDPNSKKDVVNFERNAGIKYKAVPPSCTPSEYKAVLEQLQIIAKKRALGIPLHFSFDQEGGSSADFSFGNVTIFPKPMGLTATGDPALAYRCALAVAQQSRAVGFSWVHSPVLDVCSEPENPEIYTRAYSDDAKVVAQYAEQTCRGLKEGGLIATAKHFPGRGHSKTDAHFGVPVIDVDKKTLHERELLPYKALIEKGLLPSIMIAHTIFPALDPDHIATLSHKILTDLLRNEMGFEGVITTDSMTMGAVATQYGVANACAMSLQAGADIVLMKAENDLVQETVETILDYVHTGRITEQMLDEKVYRVLALKYEYGLFAEEMGKTKPEHILQAPEILELAQEVARRSTLIAKNEDEILPLDTQKKILIVEQKVREFNTLSWHSGILYEACLAHSRQVDYLETAYTYDDADMQAIMERAQHYETTIITSYFLRGKASNQAFLQKFLETAKTPVVIVTNTPFEEISIPQNAKNVLITFATSPANIKATADVLFGKIKPQGKMPVQNGIVPQAVRL